MQSILQCILCILFEGREKVMGDPDGFPWLPKSFSDILYSGKLKGKDGGKDGGEVEAVSVKDKVKALYFSAYWVSEVMTSCLLVKS